VVLSLDGGQKAAESLTEFLAARLRLSSHAVELGSCLPEGLNSASLVELKEEQRQSTRPAPGGRGILNLES
jgi:hypothetical protein